MAILDVSVDTNVDVSVDRFVSQCSESEIKQLVKYLRDKGHLNNSHKNTDADDVWEKSLHKLSGLGRLRLSNEDEQVVLNIASKL